MYMFFAILLVVVGIFMIFAVLIQNSKGGGLAANFASGNQTFGVRQTADIIEKITWYLVVALFVFCFSATASIPDNVVKENRSAVQDRVQGQTPGAFPVTGLPSGQESETEGEIPSTTAEPESE
ncbi:MAG: preprotein translocase subunit SecG [Prevotellaceae bacterium]|jgi:preprotein translocase subunit SecG|nr:preprotein translocase subunit SecG [Prevotellaceae bacterium]